MVKISNQRFGEHERNEEVEERRCDCSYGKVKTNKRSGNWIFAIRTPLKLSRKYFQENIQGDKWVFVREVNCQLFRSFRRTK